ncbi:MAG: DUF1489 domain-containing protein [Rhodovibrionaceae bacterium]
MTLNLIKLSVGSESIDSLAGWQQERLRNNGRLWHATRMTPRRREELLDGGSIYWVIKGYVQARQRVIGFDQVLQGAEGEERRTTLLLLDPELVAVEPRRHRPFQGWRYLQTEDAPRDLGRGPEGGEDLPPEMLAELRDLGLL